MALCHHRPAAARLLTTGFRPREFGSSDAVRLPLSSSSAGNACNNTTSDASMFKSPRRLYSTLNCRTILHATSSNSINFLAEDGFCRPTTATTTFYRVRHLTTIDPKTSYIRNINDLQKAAGDTAAVDFENIKRVSPHTGAGGLHAQQSPALSYEKNIDTLREAAATINASPLPPSPDFNCMFEPKSSSFSSTKSSSSSSSSSTAGTVDENLDGDVEHLRRKLLNATLPFVREHGWSARAIAKGAEQLGEPSSVHGLFQRGGVDLVLYFYHDCNRRLRDSMTASGQHAGSGVSQTIKKAVRERLEMLGPVLDVWPQALATLAMPQNSLHALRAVGELVDDIWYHAGDRSSSFTWYTKRASLLALYSATELFMLQDTSTGFEETWSFLDRRVRDIGMLSKVSRKLRNPFSSSPATMTSKPFSAAQASTSSPYYTPPPTASPLYGNASSASGPFSTSSAAYPTPVSTAPMSPAYSPPSSSSSSSPLVGGSSSGILRDPTSAMPFSTNTAATKSSFPGVAGMPPSASRNDNVTMTNPLQVVGETLRNVFGAQKPGGRRN